MIPPHLQHDTHSLKRRCGKKTSQRAMCSIVIVALCCSRACRCCGYRLNGWFWIFDTMATHVSSRPIDLSNPIPSRTQVETYRHKCMQYDDQHISHALSLVQACRSLGRVVEVIKHVRYRIYFDVSCEYVLSVGNCILILGSLCR